MPAPSSSVTLSIVIPMFNEEAVLPLLVERLRPLADGLGTAYEVVAVDDGSSDATPVLLERLRREWPRAADRAAARQLGPPGRDLGRAAARARRLRRHPRRRPPGPAGGHRRDAARSRARTTSTSSTACARTARPTPPSSADSARLFYRTIRRLGATSTPRSTPATTASCRGPPSTPSTRCPSTTACCGSSCRRSASPPPRSATPARCARPGRRSTRSPRCSGSPSTRSPASRSRRCASRRGWGCSAVSPRSASSCMPSSPASLGHALPGWTSTVVIVAAVGAVQLLALGILGEYVGRMYAVDAGPADLLRRARLAGRPNRAHRAVRHVLGVWVGCSSSRSSASPVAGAAVRRRGRAVVTRRGRHARRAR